MSRLVELPALDGAHALALRRGEVLVVVVPPQTDLVTLDAVEHALARKLERSRFVVVPADGLATLELATPTPTPAPPAAARPARAPRRPREATDDTGQTAAPGRTERARRARARA